MTVAVLSALDDAGVNPGVLGFVVVALLGVATWLLIRSMNRQIKKIDLPDGGPPGGGPPPDDEQPAGEQRSTDG